jgi:hypothetical protein
MADANFALNKPGKLRVEFCGLTEQRNWQHTLHRDRHQGLSPGRVALADRDKEKAQEGNRGLDRQWADGRRGSVCRSGGSRRCPVAEGCVRPQDSAMQFCSTVKTRL